MNNLEKFRQKHNVGIFTIFLLGILAMENNILHAMDLYPGIESLL